MTRRLLTAAGCLGAAVLSLVGCADGHVPPVPPPTVDLLSDYPAFDRAQLVADATFIAEGTVTAIEYTVTKPRHEPGDSPEQDPLFRLSEEERATNLAQNADIPTTVVTFRVAVAHRGDVEPDQDATILQSGGVVNDVVYREAGGVALEEGERYLLFGADSFDGSYYILGGTAGMYLESGDGTYVAAKKDSAPFQTLTRQEMGSIVE